MLLITGCLAGSEIFVCCQRGPASSKSNCITPHSSLLPSLLSPASASPQFPSVWELGAATRKQSPEAPGQELLQAWLTAWGFTSHLIENPYCCAKYCYIFVCKPRLRIAQVRLAMPVSWGGAWLFVSDKPLIAARLVQIWCVHPRFWLRVKQCVIALRGVAGEAVSRYWIPLNWCWICRDQSYLEKR